MHKLESGVVRPRATVGLTHLTSSLISLGWDKYSRLSRHRKLYLGLGKLGLVLSLSRPKGNVVSEEL